MTETGILRGYTGPGDDAALPRCPGSWPGYRFTGPPLSLPAALYALA